MTFAKNFQMCHWLNIGYLTDRLIFWPPCAIIKLRTCCCPVRCKAFRNLLHSAFVSSRPRTASLRSYTVFRLRTSANCLRVRTSRLSNWFNNPKSGSMIFDSWDLSFLMVAVRSVDSVLFLFRFTNRHPAIMQVWLRLHLEYSTKQHKQHCFNSKLGNAHLSVMTGSLA